MRPAEMKTQLRQLIWGISFAILLTASHSAFAFFDPTVGRFVSRDPIEENGGKNLYRFAANNPISLADGLGLATIVASSDQNLKSTISDFFDGGSSDTWIFNYPHQVAQRFQKDPHIDFIWSTYAALASYCNGNPRGALIQKIDYQYTATVEDFQNDIITVLGFYSEGMNYRDFGMNSFGSFHASGFMVANCCKRVKMLKLRLTNTWSMNSLLRNPITRNPILHSHLLEPVDVEIDYDLRDKF
jgi:hypothetical protein